MSTRRSRLFRRALMATAAAAVTGGSVAATAAYLHGKTIAVLDPKGPIAAQERDLILIAAALSLLVVVPVFVLAITFAIRYREGNSAARYSPDLVNSPRIEAAWWLAPTALIGALGVLGWTSAHSLDPYVSIPSAAKPVSVQVIALDWKWLFIYPDQQIACVNQLVIPDKTPVDLALTADAPMNSFWIPQLGGQIYAMPGMATQLHLESTAQGTYAGSSANISGVGFSEMTFNTRALSASAFDGWAITTRQSSARMDAQQYAALAQPGTGVAPACYSYPVVGLFNSVIAHASSAGMRPTRTP